jgi:hypothetical protein
MQATVFVPITFAGLGHVDMRQGGGGHVQGLQADRLTPGAITPPT